MANYFWVSASPGATGNWTAGGNGSRWYTTSGGLSGGTKITTPPTLTDLVIFDQNSGTGTCTIPANTTVECASLRCASGTGSLAIATGTSITITGGAGTVINVYGDITLSPNGIFDPKQFPKVVAKGAPGNPFITCNGNTFGDLDIDAGATTIFAQDPLLGTGNATLNLISGTLDIRGLNSAFGTFYTGGTATRRLDLVNGTFTGLFEGAYQTSETPWNVASTSGLTANLTGSTIRLLHSSNSTTDNASLITGLKVAITSSTSTSPIQVVETLSFPTSGNIMIDNEVISYVGVNTVAKTLGSTSITRGAFGTTASTHIVGSGVFKLPFASTSLTVAIPDAVSTTPLTVADVYNFPSTDGIVKVGDELIKYVGISTGTSQLGGIITRGFNGTTATSHPVGSTVTLVQERNFYGGGLTYNNLQVGGFEYISKTNIYGNNTFTNIYNGGLGFTSTNSNLYPSYQELYFAAGATNTISTSLAFSGTASYQQKVGSTTPGTQTTLFRAA
jgi:hypothetical protein